ncbi:hypothetical protein Tco_1476655 [Tanacetum coccineum]
MIHPSSFQTDGVPRVRNYGLKILCRTSLLSLLDNSFIRKAPIDRCRATGFCRAKVPIQLKLHCHVGGKTRHVSGNTSRKSELLEHLKFAFIPELSSNSFCSGHVPKIGNLFPCFILQGMRHNLLGTHNDAWSASTILGPVGTSFLQLLHLGNDAVHLLMAKLILYFLKPSINIHRQSERATSGWKYPQSLTINSSNLSPYSVLGVVSISSSLYLNGGGQPREDQTLPASSMVQAREQPLLGFSDGDYSVVLYKVEDIATCLVKYVKYGMIGKLTVTGTATQVVVFDL